MIENFVSVRREELIWKDYVEGSLMKKLYGIILCKEMQWNVRYCVGRDELVQVLD